MSLHRWERLVKVSHTVGYSEVEASPGLIQQVVNSEMNPWLLFRPELRAYFIQGRAVTSACFLLLKQVKVPHTHDKSQLLIR